MANTTAPVVLDALEATLSRAAPVLRDLQGRAISLDQSQRTPLIIMRLITDDDPATGKSWLSLKAGQPILMPINVSIDAVLRLTESVKRDADLAALVHLIRATLVSRVDEPALRKLLASDGLVCSGATYGYPENGGDQYAVATMNLKLSFYTIYY